MQFNWQHWTREGTCCILNDSCSQHLSDHALILIFFNLAVMIRSHTIISVTPLGVFLIWFFITYRKQRSHTNLVTTCFKDNEGLLTSAGWKPHLLVEHLCELLTWRVLCKYEGASRSMLMACSSPLPSSWFSSTIILPPSFCNVLSVVLRDILVIPRTESPWSLTFTPPTWNSVFCYFQLVVTGSSCSGQCTPITFLPVKVAVIPPCTLQTSHCLAITIWHLKPQCRSIGIPNCFTISRGMTLWFTSRINHY